MKDEFDEWYYPILGDGNILLGRDSSLRRIPVNINPKQALFVDGIRHSVEILDVAFKRLRVGLTDVALNPPTSEEMPFIGASLFLDAWATVDAIDKFRQLYLAFPSMTRSGSSSRSKAGSEALQAFRNLRNIGDHIAARADWIVAKDGGGAMGELSWLTGAQLLPSVVAWHCIWRPGTLRTKPTLSTSAIETTLDWPTDCICLKIGDSEVNISQIRIHIAARTRHLESQLAVIFSKFEGGGIPVINDYFSRRPVGPNGESD